jgi:hypothetical protein
MGLEGEQIIIAGDDDRGERAGENAIVVRTVEPGW